MRIERCYHCGATVYPGHGICFVRNDAKLFRFCTSKCHKNFKMKRNPRKTRWAKAHRQNAGKELSKDDSVFEFEKKRNVPVKYDRELVTQTIKAMKRIAEITSKRKQDHFAVRMKAKKTHDKKSARYDLERNIQLIEVDVARQKRLDALQNVQVEPEKIKEKKKTKKASDSMEIDD